MISRDARNLFIPVNKDCGLTSFLALVGLRKTARNSRGSGSSHGGLTFEYDNAISQVCGHDKVVFDDERCLLSVEDVPA